MLVGFLLNYRGYIQKQFHFRDITKGKDISLKGKSPSIDFLIFITAKHYECEMLSQDKDMKNLEKEYINFIKPNDTQQKQEHKPLKK